MLLLLPIVAGGRPRAAHYFVGTAGERLLLLDPHRVQPALRRDAADLASCHYTAPTIPSMPLLELDPSLALGFLLPTRASFIELCDACAKLFPPGKTLAPFSIAREPPDFVRLSETEPAEEEEDDLVLL